MPDLQPDAAATQPATHDTEPNVTIVLASDTSDTSNDEDDD